MMYDVGEGYDFYYGHDHLYSVVVIFEEEESDVWERREYDAYGEVQILSPNYEPRTTSLCGNPYYFTGRRRDTYDEDNFNIYYYRARYYDAETGRFLSRDPLGTNPFGARDKGFAPLRQYQGGINLYEYVNSAPVVRVDPYGLKKRKTTKKECLTTYQARRKHALENLSDCLKDCGVIVGDAGPAIIACAVLAAKCGPFAAPCYAACGAATGIAGGACGIACGWAYYEEKKSATEAFERCWENACL